MKKTITLIFAAAAMMLSFASCQKDEVPATSNDEMMVVCEFDGDLKTTLNADGKTPQWAVGDQIKILVATESVEKTLTAEMIQDGKIYFTIPTTEAYQGDVYAVYPAKATEMTSCADGNITFTIPETQDGTFASANICVAKGVKGEGNYVQLVFSNVTSVFKFKQTAATTKVTSVLVSSSNAIAGTLTASFDGSGKAVVTPSSLTSKKVKMTRVATAQDEYFLSVAPVAADGLKCIYSQSDLLNSPDVKLGNKTLVKNKIYGCPTMDGREYKIQTGKIGDYSYVQIGDVKWATNNVAITESGNKVFKSLKTPLTGEDVVNGDYFQWAAHKDYALDYEGGDTDNGLLIYKSFMSEMCGDASDVFEFKFKTGSTKYQFKMSSISPYYTTETYTKYTSHPATLESSDDVASICWGDSWRMPTTEEFQALYDATKWTWDDTDKGCYVTEKGVNLNKEDDKSNAIMFFPAAGRCDLENVGIAGYYWSSSLFEYVIYNFVAYCLIFESSSVSPHLPQDRSLGFVVRPVSD